MKNNRREFIKLGTQLAAGMAFLPGCKLSTKKDDKKTAEAGNAAVIDTFGLQLYTLREDFPKDPKGVLQKVASYGYKQVESFEGPKGIFWGMTNTEFKSYLDGLGMAIVSSHCDINK